MDSLEFNRIIDAIIRRRFKWEQHYELAMENHQYEIADSMAARIGAANQIIADLNALREAGL